MLIPDGTVSVLPANPTDGQIIYYLADATNGVVWTLKYRARSASSFKWEFIGGPPLVGFDSGTATRTAATYNDPNTGSAGPSVALPLAGDYMVATGAILYHDQAGPSVAAMSYNIGATAAVDADALFSDVAGVANKHHWRSQRKTGLTAVTLTMKYKSGAGTTTYKDRAIQVIPVRVG